MKYPQWKRSPGFTLLRGGVFAACLLIPTGTSLFTLPASAQVTTASLSGTVLDNTGAIIPNAPIPLRNELSGDKRAGTTNSLRASSPSAGLPSPQVTIRLPSVLPGSSAIKRAASTSIPAR